MTRRTSILFVVAAAGTMICVALSTADWKGLTAARWAWLPGTLFGVVVGAHGTIAWVLARRGRGRTLVMTCGMVLLGASSGMLVGGAALLLMGRPFFIWYPWLATGVVGCIVVPLYLSPVGRCYQEAEMRRLSASDVSST